ncbi:MAG: ATP-dependent DNA helicase RuvB [Planctomycetes bacterium DG_58]|nr:MAG: ATP-dependent DNA helicase RuvB [Planctomycetes bacterium DG_58]KPL04755.1 MAG: ATP-dependent DNA helicase RuvB [Planctomycetes bacterium SM23_65]
MSDNKLPESELPEEELTLRPRNFSEFIGQKQTVSNLRVYIEAARSRGEALDHILFSGPPGLGKTTLGHIVAHEIGTEFRATSGPVLEKPADLAGILTKLGKFDVLFIDEVHRVNVAVEEYLYSAMEDYSIDILIDQGPHARSIKIEVRPFTLIGATTREGLLTTPFRARFGVLEKLNYYPPEEILEVVRRSARILKIEVDEDAAEIIAGRSRGTPREANRYLRRIRDLAQVKSHGRITAGVAEDGLEMLGIDEAGLSGMDRRILRTLIRHGGGPLGIKTIAVSVGETEDTIEDVYEPYLIQQGFLKKTPRGRVAARRAFEHMGNSGDSTRDDQPGLFK